MRKERLKRSVSGPERRGWGHSHECLNKPPRARLPSQAQILICSCLLLTFPLFVFLHPEITFCLTLSRLLIASPLQGLHGCWWSHVWTPHRPGVRRSAGQRWHSQRRCLLRPGQSQSHWAEAALSGSCTSLIPRMDKKMRENKPGSE